MIPIFSTVTATVIAGASNTYKRHMSHKKKQKQKSKRAEGGKKVLLNESAATELSNDLEVIFLRDLALFRDCLTPIPLAVSEELEDMLPWDVP